MSKRFEEVCTDITTIFIALDLPRPHIHPLTNGLKISIREDNYNRNVSLIPTKLFKLLDDYIGTEGIITITNNNSDSMFYPNLNIIYNDIGGLLF